MANDIYVVCDPLETVSVKCPSALCPSRQQKETSLVQKQKKALHSDQRMERWELQFEGIDSSQKAMGGAALQGSHHLGGRWNSIGAGVAVLLRSQDHSVGV